MASEEDIIPEDRFTAVTGNSAENLCFLCLKEAAFLCKYFTTVAKILPSMPFPPK